MNIIKLYELEKEFPIKVIAECTDKSKFLTIEKLDGSWGNGVSEQGERVYLRAMEKLKKVEDKVYKLA